MPAALTFGEILDAADELPLDEQRELAAILGRRIAEAGRQRVLTDVIAARAEFERGECRPATVDEIMAEIEQ